MNKFKGTPGPWSAKKYHDDSVTVTVTDKDGFEIVEAPDCAILLGWEKKGFDHWGDDGGHRELSLVEQSANAHLIAAAPELLEALQNLVNDVGGSDKKCGHDYECVCAFKAAKVIIKKALGE